MRTDAISYLLNQIALIFSDRIFITAADNREMLPNRCHDNGLITAFGVFTPYYSGRFVRGQPLLSFFGAKLLSSPFSKCVLFSQIFVSVLLSNLFSNLLFNLLFLRTQRCWERHEGRIDYIVLNGFLLGKPHYIRFFA